MRERDLCRPEVKQKQRHVAIIKPRTLSVYTMMSPEAINRLS